MVNGVSTGNASANGVSDWPVFAGGKGALQVNFNTTCEGYVPGDPTDESTTLAPLSSQHALEDILAQVAGAIQHGAKVLMGGKKAEGPGAFLMPTVLTEVSRNNPAYRQEFLYMRQMHVRLRQRIPTGHGSLGTVFHDQAPLLLGDWPEYIA